MPSKPENHFAAYASRWATGRLIAATSEFGKAIVEQFLRKYLLASEQILAEERKVYRSQPSPTLKGQIQYHAHQVATIRWLLAVNSQSMSNGENHDGSQPKRSTGKRFKSNAALGSAENR